MKLDAAEDLDFTMKNSPGYRTNTKHKYAIDWESGDHTLVSSQLAGLSPLGLNVVSETVSFRDE